MCTENITANYSSFMKKCKDDEFICMVQKFSYTTSTENATSSQRLWSLERKCASTCEAGCIVIGERTKLYACTSCCRTPYCNTDRGAAKLSTTPTNPIETVLVSIFIITIAKLLASPNPSYNCWQHSHVMMWFDSSIYNVIRVLFCLKWFICKYLFYLLMISVKILFDDSPKRVMYTKRSTKSNIVNDIRYFWLNFAQ